MKIDELVTTDPNTKVDLLVPTNRRAYATIDNDGYWATDMGDNWCDGCDDGALYVCDGVDTWVLRYTPASYPHPLRGEDINPPTHTNPSPNGTLDGGTIATNISLTTDVNATCRYSNTSNTNYTNMTGIFTNTNSTDHSTEVSGLENGNTYIYYIRCNSTDGYVNDDDWNITFSIAGHEADTDNDGVIDMPELMAIIARWKANSTDISKAEVEEARGVWYGGGGY